MCESIFGFLTIGFCKDTIVAADQIPLGADLQLHGEPLRKLQFAKHLPHSQKLKKVYQCALLQHTMN